MCSNITNNFFLLLFSKSVPTQDRSKTAVCLCKWNTMTSKLTKLKKPTPYSIFLGKYWFEGVYGFLYLKIPQIGLLTQPICKVDWFAKTEIYVLAVQIFCPLLKNIVTFEPIVLFKILQNLECTKAALNCIFYYCLRYVLPLRPWTAPKGGGWTISRQKRRNAYRDTQRFS